MRSLSTAAAIVAIGLLAVPIAWTADRHIQQWITRLVASGAIARLAERLLVSARPEDTVARLGGDELAILLEEISSLDDAAQVAERILDAMRLPFTLASQEQTVRVSVGIAARAAAPPLLARRSPLPGWRLASASMATTSTAPRPPADPTPG